MDYWAYWKVWLSYIDPATNQECDLVLVENPDGEKAGEWGKKDFATYWMGAEEDDDGNIKLSAGYNRTFPIGACFRGDRPCFAKRRPAASLDPL
jgi:hypothetical protein